MLFNSWVYWLFLPLVVVVYHGIGRWSRRGQIGWLLAASYVFYAWWDWRFVGLILLSTVVDFTIGKAMGRRNDDDSGFALAQPARKRLLLASVFVNLGLLGAFKYTGFFVESAAELLAAIGLEANAGTLNIALPVGISFYTFQTMSYTIDVYRGQLKRCTDPLHFASFVALFPQLVAGPIVRASDFLPQLEKRAPLVPDKVYSGGFLILWGLFKKVVIADGVAGIANEAFIQSPGVLSAGTVLISTYAFAIQIYCDFSGYTDIARGSARLLGYEFPLNFNIPYAASNPSEFWRRWHMSLSTWLRDYLYISLGGNRHGERRTRINLMATMVLGGLWHGAAWNYVLWGFYQGALLVVHRVWRSWRPAPEKRSRVARFVIWFCFFHLVCYGWLLFRADSWAQIVTLTDVFITRPEIGRLGKDLPKLLFFTWPLLLMQWQQYRSGDLEVVLRQSPFRRGLIYTALFLGIVWFGNFGANAFIYFQF